MFNFFIDTADTQYIKKIKSTFGGEGIFSNLKGITTNPNAMSKINRHSLREWEEISPTLCELVSEMRRDDKGEVHVQAPSSAMTGDAVLSFAQHIHSFTDGNTKLALKIPPSLTVLLLQPPRRSARFIRYNNSRTVASTIDIVSYIYASTLH